jgi:hypothetical protein
VWDGTGFSVWYGTEILVHAGIESVLQTRLTRYAGGICQGGLLHGRSVCVCVVEAAEVVCSRSCGI